MSLIPDNWILINSNFYPNLRTSKTLLKYSDIFLKLLSNRNIDSEALAVKFLKNPESNDLYDPFLLPNMEIAVERIIQAIKKGERILIFGDYDCDGVISTSLMLNFLKKFNSLEPKAYIPDRIEEGYDINTNFIKKIKEKYPEINLIICVDCGTNSTDVMEYINKDKNLFLDIIVSDHHKMTSKANNVYNKLYSNKDSGVSDEMSYDSLRSNYIIINPQLENSTYPFKFLSGAGVTFKFINAILKKIDTKYKNKFNKNYLTSLLDLVAISIISDLMPIVDENRVLVKWGLKILKNTNHLGLSKLIKSTLKDKKDLSTYDIGYIIAPRLNASGRLESAIKSLELLTCDYKDSDYFDKIDEIIDSINHTNEKRKVMFDKIVFEIIGNNKDKLDEIVSKKRIYIDKSKYWHEGLIGLAASEISKKFNIPVVLFKEDEKKLKGSGRSTEDFDLFSNLNELNYLYDKFGGHEMACGLTISKNLNKDNDNELASHNIYEKYDEFKQKMEKIALDKLSHLDFEKKRIYYDCEINFSDINNDLLKELKLIEPIGIGNPKPLFLTRNCTIKKKNFFKNNKHVSLLLEQNLIQQNGVLFNLSDKLLNKIINCTVDKKVSIVFYIDENVYNGLSYLQLIILDLCYK